MSDKRAAPDRSTRHELFTTSFRDDSQVIERDNNVGVYGGRVERSLA